MAAKSSSEKEAADAGDRVCVPGTLTAAPGLSGNLRAKGSEWQNGATLKLSWLQLLGHCPSVSRHLSLAYLLVQLSPSSGVIVKFSEYERLTCACVLSTRQVASVSSENLHTDKCYLSIDAMSR